MARGARPFVLRTKDLGRLFEIPAGPALRAQEEPRTVLSVEEVCDDLAEALAYYEAYGKPSRR